MLSEQPKRNIAQWVSEFPRYSHVINDPSMLFIFANDPPPIDATEVPPDLWDALTNDLKG